METPEQELARLIEEQRKDDASSRQWPEFPNSLPLAGFGENFDLERLGVITRTPVRELRDQAELHQISKADHARQPASRKAAARYVRERRKRDPEYAERERARHRAYKASRRAELPERACACGCGERFTPARASHTYAVPAHRKRKEKGNGS